MKAATAVLGIGNPIMTDEGIGVVLLQRLEAQAATYPDVDFIEVGTGGMKLLHLLEGYQKAIFIDCAYMGCEPGTIRRFKVHDVETQKDLPDLSLHEGDLLLILRKAHALGLCPDDVVIFGIEPERMEPGHELTETLQGQIEQYEKTLVSELKNPTVIR